MKKQLACVAFILAFAQTVSAQIPKTMRRLPDTGQTQSFTNTPGEDSDFEQNPPFFLLNGNGTATDTVTGLMWQQADGGEMTFENAEIFCQNLSLGGFTDWRLPTAQEAFSILNHGNQNPPLDPGIFPNSGAEYWWTGEKQVGNPAKVWVTNAGGGIGNHPKSETISAGGTKKFHARAVRDVQPPEQINSQFSNQDSTVLDNLTGLEWQRYALPDSMTWENALVFAQNFVLAGKADWRLPNIKELQSLNDETLSQPSIHPGNFPGIGLKKYWASTSLPNQTAQAWFMDTRFGVISYALKTLKNNVVLVRGSGNLVSATDLVGDLNGFRVFPNPFSSKIWVETEDSNAVFQLFDGLGRLIFFGKNLVEQDFSRLPGGVYFLKISGKNTPTLRLFKI